MLQYRNTEEEEWIDLNSASTTLIIRYEHNVAPAVFESNSTRYYRVCAKNGVGMGACSANISVLADEIPTFMNVPVVSLDNVFPKWILITWDEITSEEHTGRDTIIFYDL